MFWWSSSHDDYDYDEDADLLDSDCDDSVFSQSFFTLDSDASRTTWDESTMYTDALSSFNTMDHDDDSLSYTTGFTEYEKFKSVKSKKGNGGIGGPANKNMTTANFFANFSHFPFSYFVLLNISVKLICPVVIFQYNMKYNMKL